MLTADSVYNIAKALSKEELKLLHDKISKDVISAEVKIKPKNKSSKVMRLEIRNQLLKQVFNVDVNQS
jgi:acyl-coenzyme A synthetase/AMP-(fatty) acid ligase